MSGCPYCCKPFDARTAAFRCMNRNAPEQCLEPDIALADFQGRLRYDDRGVPSADLERRVIRRSSPWGRFRALPTSTDCPTCGARTTREVCARCHNDLPSQYRATDSRSIAMIGAKFSGKSNYVGVLIHELQGRVGQRFGATLQATDERTIKRYNAHFRRLLFEEQVVIPATSTVTASPELRYPLAFQLKVGRDGRRQHVMSLVFFDTAGEDLEDGELLEQEARYVANADAVIVLVDPLQIAGVRNRLARADVELPEVRSDPMDMVTRVTNAIRAQRGIPPAKPIDRPLALVLSKLDAVRGLMDPGSHALVGDGHDGVYDEDDADEVHESVRSHVHEWTGPALENFVAANYRASRWFATSAFGRPPIGTQLSAGVSPVRVEDPVLWLLRRWGMIRSKRGSR